MVRILSVIFAFTCCFLPLNSQELPPIVNYSADTYRANNQNWMLSQGPNNEIYVANNDGLLRFNGHRWSLFPTPNQSVMRSVSVIDSKIYTGFYMDFGYWIQDDKGDLAYSSVMEERQIKPIEDEQFWQIFTFDKWLVAQSLQRLIMIDLDSENTVIIEAEELLSKAFVINDQLYFHDLNKGLYTVQNGQKLLVNNGPIALNGRLIGAGSIDGKAVFVHEAKGLHVLVKGAFKPWSESLNKNLSPFELYSATFTDNGRLILGTISNGLLALDKSNTLIDYRFDRSNGIDNNTVLSLFEDREANIWAGLDNGIACINASSHIQPFVEQNGQLGTTYAAATFDNNLYLGTNQGLFYKPVDKPVPFKKVSGTAGQVWSLTVLDNTLFCGHNSGTFVIKGAQAEKISSVQGAWDFKPLDDASRYILQGNYDGLYLLKKSARGRWTLDKKIEGFNYSAKHFEIRSKHEVIVSHEYKGVFSLKLNDSFDQVLSFELIDGLSKGLHSDLESYQGAIYYASENGVFRQDEAASEFYKVPELSQLYEDYKYTTGRMVADDLGRLWFFTAQNLIAVSTDPIDGSYQFDYLSLPGDLRQDLPGHENLAFTDNGEIIYGNAQGYLRIASDNKKSLFKQSSFDQIKAIDAEGQGLRLNPSSAGSLDSEFNSLQFNFHLPHFGKYDYVQFAYRLLPYSNQWSAWSGQSEYSIANLDPAEYTFEVKTAVNGNVLDQVLRYEFDLNPPWYLSTVALMLYVIIAAALIIGLNFAYQVYYRRQRDRMLKAKTADLELRDLAAQKEIISLKNQQLQQDIEARNRELAISTMSMIKKNTTLNKLKSELVKSTSKSEEIKPALSIIDQALKNDEDWEFFEQAFNHADKKFFKRIKEKHPALTPTDLRLCVYLRLNLSSKEIAPLLNISARSVEIKRYRLRKKLDLERDINLSEYVINL